MAHYSSFCYIGVPPLCRFKFLCFCFYFTLIYILSTKFSKTVLNETSLKGLSLSFPYFLREGLNTFVTNSIPLKSTEFVKGGPQYNDYIQTIDKVHLNNK